MSIDLDKFSDEIAGAILDVIEDERRINRSDISGVIKKITKGYIDKMQPSVGGYGVGAFLVPAGGLADATLKMMWRPGFDRRPGAVNWIDPPLLPDED